ncbi:type II secretion system protein [Peribacillus asahii]|uniref:Uncharacterized protein n=1 Tax=Peribacillus asahii TaxID=228899 RepID=A0A3Q9RQ61_9BACI|nr:type II secretion system protein [Peribacillus asahii]AZV44583.1 hypothetical protein BAOM_3974 [Peribacillus asahii]USK84257.1 type II secretion system GspH family protein [Peribacillus asahii]
MKKKLQKLLKNQKGLTLVELLAVVVILGIIGAIAVPSIANIIDNSKKDAHVANAEQLIGAARLAVAANEKSLWANSGNNANDGGKITMTELVSAGYLESAIEDPDKDGTSYPEATAYVMYNGTDKSYIVTLEGSERGISGKKPSELKRDIVE